MLNHCSNMPLNEFLRIFEGEMDATQERASTSSDPSARPGTDFCELIWENGQIMMQGQSHRAKRGPVTTDFQSFVPKPQDGRDGNGLKMSKFSAMDSMLGDFPLSVPSCEMGLDQDGEMVPWLNYAVEDQLHNDYASDFLPELSGVTINNISTENHLVFRDKRCRGHGQGHDGGDETSGSLKYGGDATTGALNTEIYARNGSGEVPQFTLSAQHNVPRSGISDVTGDNVSNAHQVASRDSNPSSLCAFASLRLQKMDAAQPSTSSGLTNFPYFSRPASVFRASHLNVSPSKRLGTDEQRCGVASSNPADSTLVNLTSGSSQNGVVAENKSAALAPLNENSAALPKRPPEDQPSAKKLLHIENVAKNDNNLAIDATMSKVGDRNVEPAGATSSACSGNSVDRASNECTYDLKRKSRETADSEGPSDEVNDESVGGPGAKKGAQARTSSKRSRAAEVHNLSERRRRDRINEKMRSLQELIPNCNKVDKASMLDEAIEYLKTLQLQVQMLSMGAGMYMHPVMLPPGMQHIHGTTMPQFSPMGLGMGMGMGFGMNMVDVNCGMKMLPFQGAHYPVPGAQPPFHGMPGSSLQPFGHPVQGLQMPVQRAPVNPMPGAPTLNIPMGLNVPGVAGSTDASQLAPSNISKDGNPQSSKEGIQQSSVNVSASAVAVSGTNTAAG